jgi:tRNA A37 threonylcarbamoyladenosine biosynthesis protein TsaE
MATSIFSFFGSLSLTASQKAALSSLESFFNDSENQVFILRGYAGTGKTTLVQGIVQYLRASGMPAMCMAPTGRAARVLSSKMEAEATTLHSAIYKRADMQLDEEKETYSTRFNVRGESPINGSVLLVDEASMLSDSLNSDDFGVVFGSGRCLSDFFTFVNLDENPQTKVVFIGDDAQLPPVGADFSPALDVAYLSKHYGVNVKEASLEEIVRYDNGILAAATAIRQSIALRRFSSFTPQANAEVQVVGSFGLEKAYFQQVSNLAAVKSSIILCVANKSVHKYNMAVRQRFFPNSSGQLCEGDRLMIAANNYRSEQTLMNGEFAEVTAVSRLEILKEVIKSRYEVLNSSIAKRIDYDKVEVTLRFRTATIRLADGKLLEVKLFEDFLFSEESSLPRIVRQALFVNLQKRLRERNPHADKTRLKQLLKSALEEDAYTNAVVAKFGYAITGHKAQGGEWSRVFVNTWGKDPQTLQHYRWVYTAFTRASRILIAECAVAKQYDSKRFSFALS